MKGYVVFLWAHDHPHPPHVHFRKGAHASDWDLVLLKCVGKGKFSSQEIREQRITLKRHREAIWRSWHAYWQNQNP